MENISNASTPDLLLMVLTILVWPYSFLQSEQTEQLLLTLLILDLVQKACLAYKSEYVHTEMRGNERCTPERGHLKLSHLSGQQTPNALPGWCLPAHYCHSWEFSQFMKFSQCVTYLTNWYEAAASNAVSFPHSCVFFQSALCMSSFTTSSVFIFTVKLVSFSFVHAHSDLVWETLIPLLSRA